MEVDQINVDKTNNYYLYFWELDPISVCFNKEQRTPSKEINTMR